MGAVPCTDEIFHRGHLLRGGFGPGARSTEERDREHSRQIRRWLHGSSLEGVVARTRRSSAGNRTRLCAAAQEERDGSLLPWTKPRRWRRNAYMEGMPVSDRPAYVLGPAQ